MAQFYNSITLCGIVTDISKEHLGEGDLSVWRIAMFTEHRYAVDNYNERSHFSVLVFPDVVSCQFGEHSLKRGDWVEVRGRLRVAVNSTGETFAEIVAKDINIVDTVICLPEAL